MLTNGIPFIQAKKAGGMQKLHPVLTTTSYSLETYLEASGKALMSLGMKR